MVTKPNMGVLIMTQNDCYTKGRAFTPKGIVVHSTGANNPYLKRYVGPDDGVLGRNTNNNHWNKPGFEKCGNGFIGKTDAGDVMIYQTLPWDWRPWLCGKGSKGTYNDTHIQFEMCEDGLTNADYWRKVRAQAVHLCAWLCQEYGIEVSNVVGHYEAAKVGMANNHGDPQNWMKPFGDSMDLFRADVAIMLNGGEKPVPQHYIGTVKTKTGNGISLWTTPAKSTKVDLDGMGTYVIPDGGKVEVIGDPVLGSMAPCTYNGKTMIYVDEQYMVDRVDLSEPAPDVDDTDGDDDHEPPEPPYSLVISGLNAEQAYNMADEYKTQGFPVKVKFTEEVDVR